MVGSALPYRRMHHFDVRYRDFWDCRVGGEVQSRKHRIGERHISANLPLLSGISRLKAKTQPLIQQGQLALHFNTLI